MLPSLVDCCGLRGNDTADCAAFTQYRIITPQPPGGRVKVDENTSGIRTRSDMKSSGLNLVIEIAEFERSYAQVLEEKMQLLSRGGIRDDREPAQ